jgi:hypothetical protein
MSGEVHISFSARPLVWCVESIYSGFNLGLDLLIMVTHHTTGFKFHLSYHYLCVELGMTTVLLNVAHPEF